MPIPDDAPDHYVLYREDDNGARFLIDRFDSREEAERKAADLAHGGHKQYYFVEAVCEERHANGLSHRSGQQTR